MVGPGGGTGGAYWSLVIIFIIMLTYEDRTLT